MLISAHLELAVFIREALELVGTIWSEATFTLLRARLQVSELWEEVLGVVRLVELWLVWWCHGLVFNASPIDLIKPGV